ncbi:RsiV family protein [Corticimicrobacter populi]|nr:RsiV family protein [Corticimicrobacter populi]
MNTHQVTLRSAGLCASVCATIMLLGACASGAPRDLVRTSETPTETAPAVDQVVQSPTAVTPEARPALVNDQVRAINWKQDKPGCSGSCPSITVESFEIGGEPRFNAIIDHALAYMTANEGDARQTFDTLQAYRDYFWQHAQPMDQSEFHARLLRHNPVLIVAELKSGHYLTGAAHGMHATQYLNWDRHLGKVLSLDDILLPGQRPAFEQALRAAHARWLADNDDAQEQPEQYNRLWPFQPSDNVALAEDHAIIKYDTYDIAPYSMGQPELTIPYAQLQGIFRPEYLPR